ncbi:MAG: methyltransferase domain-containing protein [Sphingobacteriales bacterium]|nr:MAG: methyltransferase domain-containing protein [Sphingobacteriales bacterium]
MNTAEWVNGNYWDTRWQEAQTGWDIGYAAPAIMEFMETVTEKDIKILIPGCGNAYEAEALVQAGFSDITLLDISETLVQQLKSKYGDSGTIKVIQGDFFGHQGKYDLIIEQTFFCALNPALRQQYTVKAASLLKKNGQITGVLFNRVFEQDGPPYGGTTTEYKNYFGTLFEIKKIADCYNSIPPRKGSEVFINFKKK